MKQIVVDSQVTDYYITEDGKCWSNKTNTFLKGQKSNSGYLNYNLTLPNGSKRRLYAHRLVAQYYVDNPQGKNQVNHIDGNKDNNHFTNLEWVTPQENQQHAIKNELRCFKHVFCFSKNKQIIAEYKNIEEASRNSGVSRSLIQQEVNQSAKSLIKGMYWSYDTIIKHTVPHENLGISKEVQCFKNGQLYKIFPSANAAARWLGVKSHSHIGECCRGKIKSYKGFTWKYTQDIV